MTAAAYGEYEEAARGYLSAFHSLLATPPAPRAAPRAARRGAGDISVAALIDRADEIAGVSARLVTLSRTYIDSPVQDVREGISGHLVAQAAAELQLATELLQVAEENAGRPVPTTRAARGVQLRGAVDMLERSMAVPVDQGLPSAMPRTRAVARPDTFEQATTTLEQSASIAVSAITRRVVELGGDIALNLIVNTEWTAVVTGATLLRKDVAEKLEAVKEGASRLFARAVTVAAKTLLNVYDKLLALLGEDVQDQARKRVQKWLEQSREREGIDVLGSLVGKLYGVDAFKRDLKRWLADTDAEMETVNQTTDQVDALAGKFATLMDRLAILETAAVLARAINIPQVLIIVVGLQVCLLTVVVWAGYDYIGYKESAFCNLTTGVAEVIRESLVD